MTESEIPPFRYTAALAERIELAWQDRWERDGTFHAPNPAGPLREGFDAVAARPKFFINDMLPYPSDDRLHVGNTLGYVGTDVYGRYLRMTGHNVLHTMGFDAFGLPAEQHAITTGRHPRLTIERNVEVFGAQLRRLGLAHDTRRSVRTSDVEYYRWTQWIFLRIFNAWYDRRAGRARPIAELVTELDAGDREPGEGTNPFGRPWERLSELERRQVVDAHRLAFLHEAPVNWCPGLGTVLAPEHPMVDALQAPAWPPGTPPGWTGGAASPAEAIAAYRLAASRRSELDRQAEAMPKTGVFTGSHATNPASGATIPVFVADYVLMGYGTGAIMAVPGQDGRDWAFAEEHGLPIVRTVAPPESFDGREYLGDGPAINSGFLDGLPVAEAKRRIVDWLVEHGAGRAEVTWKLRDWLFSRQRYWGEPFPIVYDEHGLPVALPESMLPLELPDLDLSDFPPALDPDDATSAPQPPLARAAGWAEVTLDLGEGPRRYRRELDIMPQWAGSCWYELRYIDPHDHDRFVDAANERYWMGPRRPGDAGGVDLYVGGVEQAVLHLLYARFWQKVLYDLGEVSAAEPFHRLVNQGYVEAYAFADRRGIHVPAAEVTEADGGFRWRGQPVRREYSKMGKSLKNAVSPDELYASYGADTFRLHLMFSGPLEQSRPWETRAIVGSHRLLQRIWRNLVDERTGASRVTGGPPAPETLRVLHRTVAAVRAGIEALRFNTAIARITELSSHLTSAYPDGPPRVVAEPLVLMLAPLAPHVAEELWSRMGHAGSLAFEPFPRADPAYLTEETVTVPVQVNGKLRATVSVPAGTAGTDLEAAARADERVRRHLDGREVRRVILVDDQLVNFVVR